MVFAQKTSGGRILVLVWERKSVQCCVWIPRRVCLTVLIQSEGAGRRRPQHAGKCCKAASSGRRLLTVDGNPRNAKQSGSWDAEKRKSQTRKETGTEHKSSVLFKLGIIALFTVRKPGEFVPSKHLNVLSQNKFGQCVVYHITKTNFYTLLIEGGAKGAGCRDGGNCKAEVL